MSPQCSELTDELIEYLQCALINCDVGSCQLEDYWSTFLQKALEKGVKALPLSIAGAVAGSLVNFGFHKFQVTSRKDNPKPSSPRKSYKELLRRSASRSAIGSSTGFISKVGINMITGGSDLPVNLGSRVAAEVATKKFSGYFPQYTGKNEDSWTYTVAKASTSAVIGTLTYSVSHDYFQLSPMTSRIISASSSAMGEQVFQYLFTSKKYATDVHVQDKHRLK